MIGESLSKTKKCAVLGASGHGKVIAELAELNNFTEVHFFDDSWPKLKCVECWPVMGNTDTLLLSLSNYSQVVVAIGNNQVRLSKHKMLLSAGGRCAPMVHPSAIVSRYAQLGKGTVVLAGAIVNPFCEIGDACIVNTGATIDHDCLLSDGVHISPGAHLAGAVDIGETSWVGIGACVKQLIKVGTGAVVAAGATVISHVTDNQTVIGIPAKPIQKKE